MSEMTRRELLLSLPALALARRGFAQAGTPAIAGEGAEPFHAGGVRRETIARFLSGSVRHADSGASGLDGSAAHGKRAAVPGADRGRGESAEHRSQGRHERRELQRRPDHRRARDARDREGRAVGSRVERRPDEGPAEPARPRQRRRADGTPELYLGDPDGLVIQLQDTKYCGGAGALGDVCPKSGAGAEEGAARGHGSQSLHDQRRPMAPAPTRSIRRCSVSRFDRVKARRLDSASDPA